MFHIYKMSNKNHKFIISVVSVLKYVNEAKTTWYFLRLSISWYQRIVFL